MKAEGFGAAISAAIFMLIVVAAFSAAGTRMAAAVECTGPFAQCAAQVGAKCERTPEGKMHMTYYDKGGYVAAFEDCVGKVFEAHGRPNPYRPASSSPKQAAAPKR